MQYATFNKTILHYTKRIQNQVSYLTASDTALAIVLNYDILGCAGGIAMHFL